MQSSNVRTLILAGVLVLGEACLLMTGAAHPSQSSAWPGADDSAFVVRGWRAATPAMDHAHGVDFISRSYRVDGSAPMVLTIATSTEAKNIYRAGADISFLGNGYSIEPVPTDAVPTKSGLGAFVARKGDVVLLVIHAQGERRGLLGNGPVGWAAAVFDSVAARPNDYYQLGLAMEWLPGDVNAARRAVSLADELFPRIAGWYARRSEVEQ